MTAAGDGSEESPEARAARILDDLSAQIPKILNELKKHAAWRRHNKKVTWGLLISVALDITLSVFCIHLAVSQSQVTDSIHRSEIASCHQGNKTKENTIGIWERNISTFHRGAKGTAFLWHVDQVYAPVNCTRLYREER